MGQKIDLPAGWRLTRAAPLQNDVSNLRKERRPGELAEIEPDLSRERQLWCAVIIHTLYEASGRVAYAEKGERDRVQQAAIAWFTDANTDFCDVCDLAGLVPEVVRAGALRLIQTRDLPRKRDTKPPKVGLRRRRRRPPAPTSNPAPLAMDAVP